MSRTRPSPFRTCRARSISRAGAGGDWLVQDQRFADGRPDVMTYETPVLTQAVRVAGPPVADLWARTTGTDGDFVVR